MLGKLEFLLDFIYNHYNFHTTPYVIKEITNSKKVKKNKNGKTNRARRLNKIVERERELARVLMERGLLSFGSSIDSQIGHYERVSVFDDEKELYNKLIQENAGLFKKYNLSYVDSDLLVSGVVLVQKRSGPISLVSCDCHILNALQNLKNGSPFDLPFFFRSDKNLFRKLN